MAEEELAPSETPAQNALRKAYAQLVRDLVPGNIHNELFSSGFLSGPQLEEIRGLVDKKMQTRANEEIVLAMLKRSDDEIVTFCRLLFRNQLRKCGELLLNALKAEKVEGLSDILTAPVVTHRTPQYYPKLDEMEEHFIDLMILIKEVASTKQLKEVISICNCLLTNLKRIERVDTTQARSRVISPNCSSDEAIDLMQQFIDYLDCRLLFKLIRSLKNEMLKAEWDKYCEKLRDACRKSLHACKSTLKDYTPPPNGLLLGLQTTFAASDLQIQKIFEVQEFLRSTIGLEEIDFQGFACSDVTLFFAITQARLPFLLRMFARQQKALEDFGIAVVFVPGEFMYDVVLDQEHPFSQEGNKAEREQLGKLSEEVCTLRKTFSDWPASSKAFELAEHKWDESVQKTSSVFEAKLTGVVDAHVKVVATLSKELEHQHQVFMDQHQHLLEEHHQKFNVELKQLQEFKSTLFTELQRYIESEIKKQKDGTQFEVPSKLQGIIIGSKGQNLRRIESKTGVFNIRIVPGPNEDIARVIIIGDNRRCEAAKKEILITVAKTQFFREKKIAILTAVQGDFKLSVAEFKGTLPATYQDERRFRKFFYFKLYQPAKTQATKVEEAEVPESEVLDWSKLRNFHIVSARFLNALEEALKPGPTSLGLEARFGKVFFKADREQSMHELQGAFLVSNVEKDGLIDVSKTFGTFWTFVTAMPKSKFQVSDLRLPLIWEFETVDVTFTHIPKDPTESYVHFVLHTYRDNKGVFQFMDVRPKLGKDLVFDCLSLHCQIDMRLVLSTAAKPREMDESTVTRLGKAISAGLDVKDGIVILSDNFLKDVDEEFRVSFVRHEVKSMYLAKDEGQCYIVAHCTVEECDTTLSGLPDNPTKFPLGDRHQELELKNSQWLVDFSHMMGVNWKEEVSSFGCDVSEIHLVPKPVDPVTVVEELKHFAKYALQIVQGWGEEEEED